MADTTPPEQSDPRQPAWKRCTHCGREFDSAPEYSLHRCPVRAAGLGRPLPITAQPVGLLVKRLSRFVYTHNPFYLISAGLLLVGLNTILGTSRATSNPWVLLVVMLAYTSLMAVTGFIVVRLGKVWEDARTILLVVVLLFLAMSVIFDEIIVEEVAREAGSRGVALMCCGLVFAVVLSEALLRGLRIRLPLAFRIPYHALLVLFFAYPLALRSLLAVWSDAGLTLAIFAFPTLAALLFLGLLPAIRKGSGIVKDNGTPWAWPWFPWVVFAVLALAVCARSYYLTLSFHAEPGQEWAQRIAAGPFTMDSIFGLYFLVPLVMVGGALLLETGLVERKRWLQTAALFVPALALLMAFPDVASPDQTYQGFLQVFVKKFGSPMLLTLVAALLYYGVAWARGVRHARAAFAAAMVLLVPVGPETLSLSTLAGPQPLPMIAVGAILLWIAIHTRRSHHAFLAVVFVLGSLTVALRHTAFVYAYGAAPLQLLYAATLLIGALYRDAFARHLRRVVAVMHVPALIAGLLLWSHLTQFAPLGVLYLYVVASLVVPFAYGMWVRDVAFLHVAAVNAGICLVGLGTISYTRLKAAYGARLVWPFFASGVSFIVAFVISLVKIRGSLRRLGGRLLALFRPHTAEPAA